MIGRREQDRFVVHCIDVLQQADDDPLQLAQFVLVVTQLCDRVEFV